MTVRKIVLTGGPCAGKSSALAYISENFMSRGWKVLIVQEAATFLMRSNLLPNELPDIFQSLVIKKYLSLEEMCELAARTWSSANVLIVCDRGIPDCGAYMGPDVYRRLIEDLDIGTVVDVRDGRYENVFHLRSAAIGAASFYTAANNETRKESLEEARLLDERTLACWRGHPHLRVIDNSTDFDGKLARLDKEICRALGIPVPLEIEKKYWCKPISIPEIPVPVAKIDIEQLYLRSGDPSVTLRVRKRGQDGGFVYFRTEKRLIRPGTNIETESLISASQYEWSAEFRDPSKKPLRKERRCFIYDEQYFELDVIPTRDGLLHLLEIELTEENDVPRLPPFVTIIEEVTDDPNFSNAKIAERV